MDTLPVVTLIVKAPNQQIEDQQVQCQPSWTIHKLKQHLSEVYPSKPAKHEQKLIYSGQLLGDSVVLKDVLRQYEGQDTHTVHLVCTPKLSTTSAAVPKKVPVAVQPPVAPVEAQDAPEARSGASQPQPVGNNAQQWYNYNVEQSEQFARHVAMQQAYFQFLTHYMNMAAHGANATYLNPGLNQDSLPGHLYQQQPQQDEATIRPQEPEAQQPVQGQAQAQTQAQAQVQAQAQAQAQAQIAAQQQQQRDEPQPNRDWLDVFYMFSRVMVFISIVYFYSSPLRFFCVVVFAFGLYLYQIGLLRNNHMNNNNILRQNGEGGAEPEQAPSRLTVVWNFFTTFFASLIPEAPNVV